MQAVHAEAGLLVEASAAEEEPAGRVVGNVLPQLAEDVATQLTGLVVAVEKRDVVDLARPAPQSDFDGQPHPQYSLAVSLRVARTMPPCGRPVDVETV